jgi:hypothetical protein
MDMNYQARMNAVLQRARQLKRGVTNIHAENRDDLLAAQRSDVTDSLLDIVRQLDSILTSAKPQVIGLAGSISVGKSSFINHLLKVDVSPTFSFLAVPMEISFRPGNVYRATVHFMSIEELKWDLRNLAAGIPPIDKPSNESPEHTALVYKLARFFDFGERLEPPHPATNEDLRAPMDEGLLRRIGSVPEEFVSPDVDGLLAQIERYIMFDEDLVDMNSLLPHVVNRVCIEGPFTEIPPGVILVETLGLNDGSVVDSQRTYNAISSFGELWFLTRSDRMLASRADLAFLSKALIGGGRRCRIVATKFDCQEGEEEWYRSEFRNNLSGVFVAHLRRVDLDTACTIQLTPEEETEVIAQVSTIPINFTGIPPAKYCEPPIGFDYWRGCLAEFGVERAANLAASEDCLKGLEKSIRDVLGTAVLPPPTVGSALVQVPVIEDIICVFELGIPVEPVQQYQTPLIAGGMPVEVDVVSWWVQLWGACCEEWRAHMQAEADSSTTDIELQF